MQVTIIEIMLLVIILEDQIQLEVQDKIVLIIFAVQIQHNIVSGLTLAEVVDVGVFQLQNNAIVNYYLVTQIEFTIILNLATALIIL